MMKASQKPTNEEKALRFLILNPQGFSEREAVFSLNFTSGRNYINTAEKLLDVRFKREWEKTADGQGQYYRYSCPDRHTAEKVIRHLNAKSALRGEIAISPAQAESILQRFND